ncbi:PREDICTED: uncharacterized protein LOC105560706 [Vollenhovia emeryi]|uniref:uncharacterized protein LOC105560706 n=1 Tax=Vollenhovia emeryi TaxID=411798 RepID=UPI0005F4536F|nr:PREDICTED: uncharacterized protein LOC105560706 [Vollenhovia emeryi]
MANSKKRKRSRSLSRDRHKKERRTEKQIQEMQNQITNLTNTVKQFIENSGKISLPTTSQADILSHSGIDKSDEISVQDTTGKPDQSPNSSPITTEEQSNEDTNREEIKKLLGIDPNDSKQLKLNFHEELRNTWTKWMKDGLPEAKKKQILELYSRKEEFYTEAPKLNTDIIPALTDIAKKRDEHFVNTQNCVGTAISALGAAISMILETPEEGIDQEKFSDLLCHAGQLLTEIFHEHSIARKSFITPLLNKSLKPTLDTTVSDEWLYSEKFRDLVKEAKTIEKAVGGLKHLEKTQKSQLTPRRQGNWRTPPANWRQFREHPIQPIILKEPSWSSEQTSHYRTAIAQLLAKNVIEVCAELNDQFISPFFLVPKPDGSNRFIINLKELNKFIDPIHFKMEDIRSVRDLVRKNDFMCTLDLKDAYYLIPVKESDRRFLRFRFEKKLYQFNCLPFGLCTSPYIFTKIMKPVIKRLRSEGVTCSIYLDDILIIEKSIEKCSKNIEKTINLLKQLGFIINYKKSSLTPSQRCKYLGFIINSVDYCLELDNEKKQKIVSLLEKFQVNNWYKVREFAKLLGTLNAACPAVTYGFIYCKRLEREKFLTLKFNGYNFEGKIRINKPMFDDLQWWKTNIITSSNPIRTQNYALEIFSDASRTGWGCFCNDMSTHGTWNEEERKHHINFLELLAAFFSLKCFASELSNREILLRLDNSTAICYVNRAGGVQFPHLSELARKIWQWCENKKLWIRASYIASKENVEADTASRITNLDTEWELSDRYFNQIVKNFGMPSVDLFATRINKKCKMFYSRFPDPDASSVDAFTVSWKNKKFYAFPPFALILRTLRKIILDQAEGVVVRKNTSYDIPPFPGGRKIIISALSKKGVREDSMGTMITSITNSTLNQYQSALKMWWDFAHNRGLDVYNASTADILSFLSKRFNDGARYSVLNTSRSAISLVSLRDISQDGLIARFLKGVFKLKPTKPKYSSTWDTSLVLNYIKDLPPMSQLKIKEAAEKLTTLLALSTAHRLQTLALIDIENISRSKAGITIKIPDLIKTSRPGSFQPDLYLPFFKTKPNLCVATCILEYLEITKNLRDKSNKRLLISTIKPHGPASPQTIGHWIKSLLTKAGIDTKEFSAYSTRHAAVSAAFNKGVDIATIRRTAGWSAQSQTFMRFYNRPIQPSNDHFARAVIL